MGKLFKGTVNIDIHDSTPDWTPYAQPVPPDGAPSVMYVVRDDVGFSALEAPQRPSPRRTSAAGRS
jgi:arylsulfatase